MTMKSPNFRSDIGFVVDDINYAYDDINYTMHDINYNMHDIGFGIAYKGHGMVAPPEAVSIQFSLSYRPVRPVGPAYTSHETSSILPSFPSLFGYFIFTQSVLGRAGSCKTAKSPYSTPIFTI